MLSFMQKTSFNVGKPGTIMYRLCYAARSPPRRLSKGGALSDERSIAFKTIGAGARIMTNSCH
jgi:hypothetical protein